VGEGKPFSGPERWKASMVAHNVGGRKRSQTGRLFRTSRKRLSRSLSAHDESDWGDQKKITRKNSETYRGKPATAGQESERGERGRRL